MRRREFVGGLAGMAAWPLAAGAQQQALPVVGFLHSLSRGAVAHRVSAFMEGLKLRGYVEGRNVLIEYRWADGQYERLPALARDLAGQRLSAIAVGSTVAALAAKREISDIPIVFTGVGGDPVKLGLVANLARPGGNVTGVSTLTIAIGTKRLELLREIAPGATAIAILVNPNNPNSEVTLREIPAAAAALGQNAIIATAGHTADLDITFAEIAQKQAEAVYVAADPFFFTERTHLVALAKRYRLPTIFETPDFVIDGGLISYAPSMRDAYGQAGVYIARILGGEKPAELPVVQLNHLEIIVNLNTAKALGLTIPESFLLRADQVIE